MSARVLAGKRDGRSIYDPQARSDLVKASQQPGTSLARIARLCGINANVLSNWVRQSERGKAGALALKGEIFDLPAACAFMAVEVAPAPATAATPAPELALRARLKVLGSLSSRVHVPTWARSVSGTGRASKDAVH